MTDHPVHIALGRDSLQLTPQKIPAKTTRKILWLQDRIACDLVLDFVDRHRRALVLVMLIFYLAAFNGQWRIQPDAALYMSIGRNLSQGNGYTYLGAPNRLAYPGWPTLIAATFKIFGSHSLLAVNALMTLIALATLAMVYRLFLLYAGRPTAVAITVGTGLTKAFFCYGFELWSDMPFAFGAMAALAGYEGVFHRSVSQQNVRRQKWIDRALLIGGLLIAGSMRPTIWPLLAAFVLTIAFHTFSQRFKSKIVIGVLALAILVAGSAFIVIQMRSNPHGFGGIYTEYLVNRISGKSFDAAEHPFTLNIADLFSWAASDVLFQTRFGRPCNSVLSALVLGLGIGLFAYRALWGYWFCLLLATILVSQEVLDRYFLPVLPLLVFAWWNLIVQLNRRLPRAWGNLIFLGLLTFGSLANLTKVSGIIAQQRERPFLTYYDKGTHETTPRFSALLQDRVDANAIVLAKPLYARPVAFLSDRYVIKAIETSVDQLQGHPVYVIEPSDLATKTLLRDAGLVEGPAVFTVDASPNHGALATTLSLHATHARPVVKPVAAGSPGIPVSK
jgi:hypothetical protein